MKKFTMILALVVMTAMPMFAERVAPETARKVATTFLNNNGAKATQLTDLSEAAGFTNLYIFNAEQGFVVMAADDCVKPILGYSLTGKFVAEGMPENISSWLQGYNDEIQYAVDNKLRASSEIVQQWSDLFNGIPNVAKATTVVDPLLTTQWNQGSPYNNLCPSDAPTGCVATAMAQVMKHWNYPAHGIGTHSYTHSTYGVQFADFNSTNYDWTNMTDTYNGSSTNDQKLAVATLMYHCGVSVNMSYGTDQSEAITADVAYALKTFFNYSSDVQYLERSKYTNAAWINMLKSDLDQSRPIQYRGNGAGGGHSFVCDGYDSDNNFHFNWGWGGNCDAYYSIDNLNPGPGGIGSGAYGIYNNNQGAIFGIHPSECTIDAPTNLTFTQSERNVTFSWDATSGAASYNLYCNANMVGNTTSTSFTDIAPYGTDIYYVRGVDSDGHLSLSSNTVSITIDYQIPAVDDLGATLSGNVANLTWTAPDWCFPETESSILTYGSGIPGHYSGYDGDYQMTWGHRFLPSDLAEVSDKVIFRVAFYARELGAYVVNIYKGTSISDVGGNSYDIPTTLVASKTVTPTQMGWFTIDLDEPVAIDASQDLWVMMYDPEYKQKPAECCVFNEHDRGSYFSTDITVYTYSDPGYAFLIRTYLTDGTYTYNLYQDGVQIAENLTGTSYSSVALNDNAANQLVVKTNYYGGEAPTNMVGYAKGNASVSTLNLGDNDMMTLLANSKLTVSGEASNGNPAHLVLKNGAQLIHNSVGVKATVNKAIDPYTADDNGWYFITPPVTEGITPSAGNGLLNGAYDLYYYDEPTFLWKNYKVNTFDLAHKQGYLYANSASTMLHFAGTLTPSNSSVSISGLSHEASTLNGFNLVGNPFMCNATINHDCYVINGNHIELATGTKTFAPCEGAFVKATSDEYTVTFTKTGAKDSAPKDYFDLVVTQGKTNIDRARVRFGEGTSMEKFTLDGDNSSQLAFWQDGQEYAVAYADGLRDLPINFKVVENGTYTIGFEANNLDLDYLHLVDNMIGSDIDLLDTPNYTFEAKTSDFASRFRLVFAPENDASTSFGFMVDGKFQATNGEGLLQIVDLNGRILRHENDANSIDLRGLGAGIYVVRLITADNMMTQKVVVE